MSPRERCYMRRRDPFGDRTVEAVVAAIVYSRDADEATTRALELAPDGLPEWVGGWFTPDRIISAMRPHGCDPGDPRISLILTGGLP